MSFDSVTRRTTLPSCCVECAHAYTIAHFQQPLETYLSQDDNPSEELEPNDDVSRIAPISTKDAGSSRLYLPDIKPLNISRNTHNDPSITSVQTRSRNPRKTQLPYSSDEHEPENLIEYNFFTSSVPTPGRPSTRRSQSRNRRETGLSTSVNKHRKHNEDLPPLPTQDTNSSNDNPRLRYPQEIQSSYGTDKPQDPDGPPSIPSVRTEDQYSYAQTRPQTHQPRVTRISFSANKPRDSDRVERPSVPIQEKSQLESNYSRTRSQSQGTQASSNVSDKLRDRVEYPKASIPTQDQSQDRSAGASKTDTRPRLMHGTPSQMDTQYVNMLLALDDIPQLHNILAGFFNWVLLAGFILFPGTFTSLKNLGDSNQVAALLVHTVTSIPLFVIAWLCTGVGATGMLWLWWRWRKNYVWALNKIFLPGAMNSLAGFLSTMVNVFGVQHGELSTTSKVTIIVTAASTGVLGILTAIYSFWLVKRVKSRHDRTVGKARTGKYGEGVLDLSKKKVNV